jgi:5-methylcytosine-specific restriction endonuclease McrA
MRLKKTWRPRKTNFKSNHDPQREVWRLAVLRRDKWRCLKCGCKSKVNLNTHHIIQWSKAPYLRYNLNNGITLCKVCHKQMFYNEESYQKMCYQLLAGAAMVTKLGKALNDLEEEEEDEQ